MRKMALKNLLKIIMFSTVLILVVCACRENEITPTLSDDEGDNQEVVIEEELDGMRIFPIEYDYYDPSLTMDTLPPMDGCIFRGKIPRKGASLVFVPKPDFVNNAYVSFVRVDDEYTMQIDPPYGKEDSYIFSASWGKVYYSTSPYTIHIDINNKESSIPREICIRIGNVEFKKKTVISELYLVQE